MSGGIFNTTDIRTDDEPQAENYQTVITHFPAWRMPIGISYMHMAKAGGPRIRAHVNNIAPADSNYANFRADVHLNALNGAQLFAAGCNWLDVSIHDIDFQFGSIRGVRLSPETGERTIDVTFKKPYREIPEVVIWFNAIEMDGESDSHLQAYASDITEIGFTLHLLTGDEATVKSSVSWIAVPTDRPNIMSGQFNTTDEFPDPQTKFTQDITFKETFKKVPKVILALNSVNIPRNHDLKIAATATHITTQGMTLEIDSLGEDSEIAAAGVGWIAIEEF